MVRTAKVLQDPAQNMRALARIKSLRAVHDAAESCKRCALYRSATQIVFGEGPRHAALMLVGEQPGDIEDREGVPFVGPAGRVLDRALTELSVARKSVYLTNVVKHFKWTPRGKRRLHQRPTAYETERCSPWLSAELRLVRPAVLVCLGATAAKALLGAEFRVSARRGELIPSDLAPHVLATVHPSSILRSRSHNQREAAYAEFRGDLALAVALIASSDGVA